MTDLPDDWAPTPTDTPYDRLGGRAAAERLASRFYDFMDADEPALVAVHDQDEPGRVSKRTRERFSLFLVGWLGGPQEYTQKNGHPRLRQRHGKVPIDTPMAEAWLRTMGKALDEQDVSGSLRRFLDARLGEVAAMLRNRPDA